ncbi:unnamed protein product [Symbiodinium natans]|uniref:Uncharacterized protein n=1 Tax=Symbiodinium natans TaxID=878477 RepID=A0A812JGM4_9DINO|nr:unnamed protein product [Symbiodinium natans]
MGAAMQALTSFTHMFTHCGSGNGGSWPQAQLLAGTHGGFDGFHKRLALGAAEEEVFQLLPTQGTCGSFDIGGTHGGFDGVRVRLALGEGEEEVRQLLPMQGAYVEALTASWRWSWERSHAGFDVVHTHVHTLREWQWRKLAAGSTTCRHSWRLRRLSQAEFLPTQARHLWKL